MLIAATGALSAGPEAPILYRGAFREIIPRMADDGFKAVELHIEDSGVISRDELWAMLNTYDVRLTSIGTGSIYFRKHYNLGDRDPDIRAATVAHLEKHMILLAPYQGIVIIGMVAGRFSDSGSPEEFEKNLTDSLYRLDALALRHNVYLGYELMCRFESDFLQTIETGVAFIRRHTFQRLLLHIDTVQMNIEERDIGRAIRAGKGFIGHVHIADNDRWYPGHAHYDFRETLQALKDIDYQGALALEMKPHPTRETAIIRCQEYLNLTLGLLE